MAVCDPTTPGEIWYPVPGHFGYELSSDWRVRSFRVAKQAQGEGVGRGRRVSFISDKWHFVKVRYTNKGYLSFNVAVDPRVYGRRILVLLVHRVVASLAFGEIPDGAMVLHADDDQENNHAANLGFGTDQDNSRDRVRNGRVPRGEGHCHARVSEEQIQEIRRRVRAGGATQAVIGREFGLSQSAVSRISNGDRWKHLA